MDQKKQTYVPLLCLQLKKYIEMCLQIKINLYIIMVGIIIVLTKLQIDKTFKNDYNIQLIIFTKK